MGCVCSRVCSGEVESPDLNKPATSGGQVASSATPAVANFDEASSEFVSDKGFRTVRVASSNYELRYGYLSRRGYYPEALEKVNQDSFCICNAGSDDYFFAVFDGHGEFGSQCSQFVRRWLSVNLLQDPAFHFDPVQALRGAFLLTNTQLRADSIDDSMSGTTSVVALIRGKVVYVANAGDSRAVLAERKENGGLTAVDLSIDHKPLRDDELQRVTRCGARVLTLDQIEGLKDPTIKCWENEEGDDGGDPPRVWVPNGMFPGTAFTRSIGDAIAESIGVIADPEIVTFELTEKNPFLVLASDGVFEFMSSQDVVNMIAKYQDPQEACSAVVAESCRLWLKYETRTDDITVIVVYINGLTATATQELAPRGGLLHPHVPLVSEQTESEVSPTLCWNSSNHPVRHESTLGKIRTSKSLPENKTVMVPSSPVQRKAFEEEEHIKKVLHDHFLIKNLSHDQYQIIVDCMKKIEVDQGEVVIKQNCQGEEGDSFYVVGSGEFEVLEKQALDQEPKPWQQCIKNKLSSFGESAITHRQPYQSSVRAISHGTLWVLKRDDYQGILISEESSISSIKILKSVNFLSKLTVSQLRQVAGSLSEVSYSDTQLVVDENDEMPGLFIIHEGKVKITFFPELLSGHNVRSLNDGYVKEEDKSCSSLKYSLEKVGGSYFGEWSLIGEHVGPLKATAVGGCVCSVVSKTALCSVVGSSLSFVQDIEKVNNSSSYLPEEDYRSIDSLSLKICFSDLEWRMCLSSTDCSEIGLVNVKGSGHMLTMKKYDKQMIKSTEKESQILKERNVWKRVEKSAFIPEVLCLLSDRRYACMLLNACLACPLASILGSALDEASAKYCAASVVLALEQLHKNGVLYRGISPDLLMMDQSGHLKLVDFRFAKLSSYRTYTICGIGDSLAPEMIQGKDHGYPVDWWALGVLIYYLLHGEMPFGYWKEKEVDTYAKISKGVLIFPPSFSPEAADLITKLLEVHESKRLGSSGAESVKSHPWFDGVEWNHIRDGHFPVPREITVRIEEHLKRRSKECDNTLLSPARDWEDSNGSEWLRDW